MWEAISVKATPEALERRKLWAADGAVAWRDYLAAAGIVTDKIARLKLERLERDAAVKAADEKIAAQTTAEIALVIRTTFPKRRSKARS
jgi:hypothetical protein